MKTFKTLGVLAVVVLGGARLAMGTPINYNYGTSASLATLEANANNYLTLGDKIFSDFTSTATLALAGFNTSGLTVTASQSGGVYYLTWTGGISVSSTGTLVTGDLDLGYTVTATAGLISEIDQNYTGGVGAGLGAIAIDETVTGPGSGGAILGSTSLSLSDMSEPTATGAFNLADAQPYIVPAQAVLDVEKDISIANLDTAGLGLTTVSVIQQSFHQVTVPDGGTTVSLLGIALMGCGLLRWKQSK